jgi:adenylate cyclase
MIATRIGQLRSLLFSPSTAALPARVQDAIRRQQDESERLTGWIQLAVVLLFGTLWAISPKTATGAAALPVPLALATYLALTVIRLVWSYRRRLPDWSLAISVAFDMGLLMVVIWSFHLTYGQPPSFYLKAPTLLYVFIFIGLRALRFDARFVLLAGVIAAAGWGLLVLYVVWAEPGNPMITRNYVAYMTSNSILLGAEFDKIISILTFSAILAVAIGRAKALLLRSVTEGLAARELSRFFDAGVAARIKGAERAIEAGMGELRAAAVLALDLRGFTKLAAERPPQEAVRLLSDYQAFVVPLIQSHGGAVDKFLGDGILASFGAVTDSARPAADALAALDAIMAAARRWQAERAAAGLPAPVVNGAMAAGQVLFGAVGDASRLEYTVIGDTVNLAAKLEKQNKVVGCAALTDGPSYDLALAQGYRPAAPCRRLADQMVAGVPTAMELVIVAT